MTHANLTSLGQKKEKVFVHIGNICIFENNKVAREINFLKNIFLFSEIFDCFNDKLKVINFVVSSSLCPVILT